MSQLIAAILLAAGVLLASGGAAERGVPGAASRAEVAWTLLLAGDAGSPADDDAVLVSLTAAAAEDPERTTVLFLGDNIYPRGLPDSGARDRPEMERRLLRQVEAGTAAGTRAIFVPGNHDWDYHKADGWRAVVRQAVAVERMSGGLAELLPEGGCPGPVVRDLGEHFRLVLLDTHWWLHRHARPGAADCDPGAGEGVVRALAEAVADAGERHVVVAGHHPLRSGGVHGGALRTLRRLMRSDQDVWGPRNRAMRAALEEAMRPHRPLVYASGHEHSLQVIAGGSARWLLVSGSGQAGHAEPVRALDSTRYAARADGFMRLDAMTDGRVRLGVTEVGRDGVARESFAHWLTAASPPARF